MKREEAIKSRAARPAAVRRFRDRARFPVTPENLSSPGCAKCRRGQGHRVWVLTVSYPGGRTRQFSIPAEQRPQVEKWLENYQKLRAKPEPICELNHELLRAKRF